MATQSTKNIVQEITATITQKPNMSALQAEEIVGWAEKLGEYLVDQGLTKSQIRKFLDAVIRINNLHQEKIDYRAHAMLMKPKLVYAVGKAKKIIKGEEIDPVGPLMHVLSPCIDKIYTKEDFDRFAQFVEAIVAYHKFYGGKD